MADKNEDLLKSTTKIVAAYVTNTSVAADDLPAVIRSVFETLESLAREADTDDNVTTQLPAVPVEESITDDHIICLEDGLPFKSLRRHLRTKFDLTPEAYRRKWGLPPDYPMVAPSYAEQRSKLAKKMGLGKSDGRTR